MGIEVAPTENYSSTGKGKSRQISLVNVTGNLTSFMFSMTMSFFPAFLLTSALLTIIPVFSVLVKIRAIRRLVGKMLPAAGTGPNREQRAKGHFEAQLVATADTEPYDPIVRVRGIVKGKINALWLRSLITYPTFLGFQDPGYGDTCRMVAESALSIVKSHDSIPGKQGGILTPATAFGQVLIDRLTHNGGMVFEVSDIPSLT